MRVMKLLAALICIALAGCNSISGHDRESPCNYFPNKDGALKINVEDFSDDNSIYMIVVVSPSSLNGRPFYGFNIQSLGVKFEIAPYHIDSEDKKTVRTDFVLAKRIVQDGVCVSASYGDLSVEYLLDSISQKILPPRQ